MIKVDPGIVSSVKQEITDGWVEKKFLEIREFDPVMFSGMKMIYEKHGANALGCALLVYRLLESQIEADELEELFE